MHRKATSFIFIFIHIFVILTFVHAIPDFSLVCRKGYRLTSIRRFNSAYQKSTAGSLSVECERIQSTNLKQIVCETLENTPQCNGWPEGCGKSQWLAGFHAYAIENSTNAVLLDPVCCSSPNIRVDSSSCATERLNNAKRPFEHRLLTNDLIYRGMQCWHQYNSLNTIVDLAWKMEICQFQFTEIPSSQASNSGSFGGGVGAQAFATVQRIRHNSATDNGASFGNGAGFVSNSGIANGGMMIGDQMDETTSSSFETLPIPQSTASNFLPNCPPCNCHCGIDVCGNGAEPIRITHKAIHPQKCSCDCACKYECV